MVNRGQPDIPGMLAAWNAGDRDALDRLIDIVYPELQRIARQHLARRRAGTTERCGRSSRDLRRET